MSDSINGVFVVFKKDLNEEDADATINAIRHIKGVLRADRNVSNFNEHIASVRIKNKLMTKIIEVFYPPRDHNA